MHVGGQVVNWATFNISSDTPDLHEAASAKPASGYVYLSRVFIRACPGFYSNTMQTLVTVNNINQVLCKPY